MAHQAFHQCVGHGEAGAGPGAPLAQKCQPKPPATPSQPTSSPTWSRPQPRVPGHTRPSRPRLRPTGPAARHSGPALPRPRLPIPAPGIALPPAGASPPGRGAGSREQAGFQQPADPECQPPLRPGAPQAQGQHRHAEESPRQQPGGIEAPVQRPHPSSHQARMPTGTGAAYAPSNRPRCCGRWACRSCCQNEAAAGRRKTQHASRRPLSRSPSRARRARWRCRPDTPIASRTCSTSASSGISTAWQQAWHRTSTGTGCTARSGPSSRTRRR